MRKAARSQHERFPAMKNDCERTNLIGSQVLKRYAKRGDRIAGNERRHIAPPVVPHVVNVAIAAIDVAAACDLDEDCVDLHNRGASGYAGCERDRKRRDRKREWNQSARCAPRQ